MKNDDEYEKDDEETTTQYEQEVKTKTVKPFAVRQTGLFNGVQLYYPWKTHQNLIL